MIRHKQYHDLRCPGDVRSQGIDSYAIDLILPKYSSPSISRIKMHPAESLTGVC